MGVATGCGCKEVYRFPHTYPTPLVSVFFCSSIPTFLIFLLMFFVLVLTEKVNIITELLAIYITSIWLFMRLRKL